MHVSVCRHGPDTVFFSGVHVNPSLEPTSVIFQQAADMGMSHSALLRHVLSRACIRAGLPPIPPPFAQDITKTALVSAVAGAHAVVHMRFLTCHNRSAAKVVPAVPLSNCLCFTTQLGTVFCVFSNESARGRTSTNQSFAHASNNHMDHINT